MKLHYFFNGQVYLGYDANYQRIQGYWYTLNQVRYYAKKHGWNGIKRVQYSFVEESFKRESELRHINATRRD